jgi:arginine N-succinyltransferase
MHPEYRRSSVKLGMQISYVRFLWLAMHRENFQDTVLAELLPPLEPDGTSHLWEAVGRKFTGLDYREADRLTSQNKEFIRSLFPDGEIYASLLPEDAQAVIGEVGAQTRGVEKLLRRIGFRYAYRVDPFDGGPHFTAPTDDISLVHRARAVTLQPGEVSGGHRALIAMEYDRPPWFRAVATEFEPADAVGQGVVRVQQDACSHLGAGENCWMLPLD